MSCANKKPHTVDGTMRGACCPGRTRTSNLLFQRQVLCRLSYWAKGVRYMPLFGAGFHNYRQEPRLHGCFAGTPA
jgi:hypothetical protein